MEVIIIGTILFGLYLIISTVFTKKRKQVVNQKNRYDSVFEDLERCKRQINDEAEKESRMGN